MKEDVKKLLQKELKKNGKKGGTTTRDRYGTDHFKIISRRGVRARRKKKEQTN